MRQQPLIYIKPKKAEPTTGARIVALAIVAIIVAVVLIFGSANNARPQQSWHTNNGTPCSQVHTAAFCAMEEGDK